MSVVDVLRAARERGADPEGVAMVGRTFYYGEATKATSYTLGGLEVEVEERVGELAAAGAEPGRIYPVVTGADEEGVLTLLALWRLGAVPAPINERLTEPEKARAVEALAGREAPGAQAVLWTSGTEGRPRGVMLGFDAMASHCDAVAARLSLGGREVWLASLSPAHVGGLMLVVRALLKGSVLFAYGRTSPEETLGLIRGDGLPIGCNSPVTHLSLVPVQLRQLLDAAGSEAPPPSFRCALLGGAHTPRDLVDRALAARWPVALTYGMTEMSSQVATASPDEVRRKPGTVGKSLDGVEVEVGGAGTELAGGATAPGAAGGTAGAGVNEARADADERGARAGAPGVLRVRGRHAALAYLDGTALVDADGWYATGDLGHRDADGDLWVTGRLDGRIITGGVNVDPIEVEEVLRSHPAVYDVAVLGMPDETWGEAVCAVVVPVEGEFDLVEIQEWVVDHLAGAKRPKRWMLTHELPRNANGKVDRGRTRELLQ